VSSTTFHTSIMLCMRTSTGTTLPYVALPSKQQRYHMLLHAFLSLLICQWIVSHNLSVFSKNPAKRSENMQRNLWSIRFVFVTHPCCCEAISILVEKVKLWSSIPNDILRTNVVEEWNSNQYWRLWVSLITLRREMLCMVSMLYFLFILSF